MNNSSTKTQQGGKKGKSSISPPPFDVGHCLKEPIDNKHTNITKFINASTLDEQLHLLKCILESVKDGIDLEVNKFLVTLFFNTEAKHPIKSCIARNINKCKEIHQQFSEVLSQEIISVIDKIQDKSSIDEIKDNSNLICKILSCSENFPPGTDAIMKVVTRLYMFLLNNLKNDFKCLSECKQSSNTEVYNSIQITLRLLLYIIQRRTNSNDGLSPSLSELTSCIVDTLLNVQMPMDTKSVAAILLLALLDGNDKQGWYVLLYGDSNIEKEFRDKLMSDATAKVCIYSAILTTVPVGTLQNEVYGSSPLILCLENILEVSERYPDNTGIAVSSSRSMHHVSRLLSSVSERQINSCSRLLARAACGRLDHAAHSVRYLATDTLANVLANGDVNSTTGVWSIPWSILSSLGLLSRPFHAAAAALIARRPLADVRGHIVPADIIHVLQEQHVQAQATSALEAYIEKYVKEGSLEDVYNDWIQPILEYIIRDAPDSPVITIMENLLIKAVNLNGDVLKYVTQYLNGTTDIKHNLKCILMLWNVVRKCNASDKRRSESGDARNEVISYQLLEAAILDEDDENRLLALGAIIDNARSTISWSERELSLVCLSLKYTANVQSPAVRDRMVKLLEKFIKKFTESYRGLLRQNGPNSSTNNGEYYLQFAERLRQLCYDSLLPGVNYSRRSVLLQMLSWVESMELDGYHRTWKVEYSDTLLLHLEDSYESNKELALQILGRCPKDVIQQSKLSSQIQFESILSKASSLKPTESVSAAYQLELLVTLFPERLTSTMDVTAREYAVTELLSRCQSQLANGAALTRGAPLYPLLHLMHSLLTSLTHSESAQPSWQSILERVLTISVQAIQSVSWVVNDSSPEGMLPADCERTYSLDTGEVLVTDDGPVTSQMILLCAWRIVKEASGCISVCAPLGSMSAVSAAGGALGAALRDMRHRGAFEQAARGLRPVVDRVWRDSPELAEQWVGDALRALGDAPATSAAPTRRGAGLVCLLQAKASHLTEDISTVRTNSLIQSILSAEPPSRSHASLQSSLSLLRAAPGCHSLLSLRALVQKTSVALGDSLQAALDSLDSDGFPERNAATLLWSSSMCRIFGPDGARRMSAYEFFHRYPRMYHTILERLSEGCKKEDTMQTSMAALLKLLSRLYPSPDGSLSDIKMEAFTPLVTAAGAARVALLRRLAASALPAVLRPHRYLPHIAWALNQTAQVQHNAAHGLCLQAAAILRAIQHTNVKNINVTKDRQNHTDVNTNQDKTIDERQNSDVTGEINSTDVRNKRHITDTNGDTQNTCDTNSSHVTNGITNTIHSNNLTYAREKTLAHASDKKTVRISSEMVAVRDSLKASLALYYQSPPCFLVLQQHAVVVDLLLCKFPEIIDNPTMDDIQNCLSNLIFSEAPSITIAREMCLTNCLYLYYILLHKRNRVQDIVSLVYQTLEHSDYEIILATFNYLLIQHDDEDLDETCQFQKHLTTLTNEKVLTKLRETDKYVKQLCFVLKNNKYLECKHKCLKLLSLEKDTQRIILNGEHLTDESIISKFLEQIECSSRVGPDVLVHVYVKSLTNFVAVKLNEGSLKTDEAILVLRLILEYSSSRHGDDVREAIVTFLENNIDKLVGMGLETSVEVEFEYKATLISTIAILLEDEMQSIRNRVARVTRRLLAVSNDLKIVSKVNNDHRSVSDNTSVKYSDGCEVASLWAQRLMEYVAKERDSIPLLITLALLDFKSEVRLTTEFDNECRVFDQSERYNVFLEESIWTDCCAEFIVKKCANIKPIDEVQSILSDVKYNQAIEKLCNDNLKIFNHFLKDGVIKNNVYNPKIELFVRKLSS